MILSIIVPVYNLEHYIARTLDTLSARDRQAYEVIVVDDGSADRSRQVVSEYIIAHPDQPIRLIAKENGGVSSARNRGAMEASGEYLLYLDGDDLLGQNSLSEILSAFRASKPDILFWPYQTVSEDGRILDRNHFSIEENYVSEGPRALDDLLKNRSFYLIIGNAAYRRDFIEINHLAFTEGCAAGEDMEFTWKCLALAEKVQYTGKPLLRYVQREGSAIHHYNIRRFDSAQALQRIGRFLNDLHQEESAQRATGYELLLNYMGAYRHCLEQKMKESHLSVHRAIKQIDADIRVHYPSLLEQISFLIKKQRRFFPLNRVAIFSLSPALYMRVAQLKQCLKKCSGGKSA